MNYLRAITLALGGYYFGYYIGITNPMADPLTTYYNIDKDSITGFKGNINSFFSLGAMVSVFLVGPLSNIIGRVRVLILAEVIGIITSYLYTIKSVPLLLTLRAVGGVITGINSGVGPVALSEMFPGPITGFGGLFLYFSITSFILLGWISAPICGNSQACLVKNVKIIFAWPGAVGILRLILLMVLFKFGALESPGFYLNKIKPGKTPPQEVASKTESIKGWYATVYAEQDVDQVVAKTLEEHEEASSKVQPGFVTMFSANYRFRLITAVLMNIFQQLSGVNFLIFYSTQLFNTISGNGPFMSLVIAGANICGAIVGLFTIERLGRRFNMMYGALLQCICFILLIVGSKLVDTNKTISSIISTASVCFYMIGFAVGLGGTMPIFCAEIIPAVGVGIAASMQWLTGAGIGQLVPIFLKQFGPDALIGFFAACLVVTFFFSNFACVETKGMDEQDVELVYKGGVSKDGRKHQFSWIKFKGTIAQEASGDDFAKAY